LKREIEEELGIPFDEIKNISFITRQEKPVKDNPSYKGIDTRFTSYLFEWRMPEKFVKSSYEEDDGKKVTSFKWFQEKPSLPT
jgi:hypothetical protein